MSDPVVLAWSCDTGFFPRGPCAERCRARCRFRGDYRRSCRGPARRGHRRDRRSDSRKPSASAQLLLAARPVLASHQQRTLSSGVTPLLPLKILPLKIDEAVSRAVQKSCNTRNQSIGEIDVEIPSFSWKLCAHAGRRRTGIRTGAAACSSGWTHVQHRSSRWAPDRLEATDVMCLPLELRTRIPLLRQDNPFGPGRRPHGRRKDVLGRLRTNVAYWAGHVAR